MSRFFVYGGLLAATLLIFFALRESDSQVPTENPDSRKATEIQTPMADANESFAKPPTELEPRTEPFGTANGANPIGHNWKRIRSYFDLAPAAVTKHGGEAFALNGAGTSAAAAVRLPDGRLVTGCFQSYEALEAFLTNASPAGAKPLASPPRAER